MEMKAKGGQSMKKMSKWLTSLSVIGVLGAGVTACGNAGTTGNTANGSNSTGGSAPQYVFRLADIQPEGYPTVVGDEAFAKEVEEKTGGRIQIKVYPGGQLGSDENAVAQQVQLGAIDFARINASPLSSFDPELNVLSLPYLFKSSQQEWDVLNGDIGKQILDSLSSAKMVGLTYYDSGARCFYNSKHPVVHPSDLKGLKIRVQQSNLFVDLVNTLGGSATPMSYNEVYNALQSGVVDGAENNLPSYYTSNHYKVAKYLTLDDHTRTPEILLASQTAWNKLSPQDQEIIRQAAIDSQKVERDAWNKLEQQALDAVKANGNVISQVDVSEWQKAVQPLYDKYGKQYEQLIQEIQQTQ